MNHSLSLLPVCPSTVEDENQTHLICVYPDSMALLGACSDYFKGARLSFLRDFGGVREGFWVK